MASYAEIKAKLLQEGKKIRKRSSYDEHNLQAAEVRYIRGVHPDLEGVFFAVPNANLQTSRMAERRRYEGRSIRYDPPEKHLPVWFPLHRKQDSER